jgi:hypothetical protein
MMRLPALCHDRMHREYDEKDAEIAGRERKGREEKRRAVTIQRRRKREDREESLMGGRAEEDVLAEGPERAGRQ